MSTIGNQNAPSAGAFYVQHGCVGNDALWWRDGRAGYTSNLNEAHVFSRDEAFEIHANDRSHVPHAKAAVDAAAHRSVALSAVMSLAAGASRECGATLERLAGPEAAACIMRNRDCVKAFMVAKAAGISTANARRLLDKAVAAGLLVRHPRYSAVNCAAWRVLDGSSLGCA